MKRLLNRMRSYFLFLQDLKEIKRQKGQDTTFPLGKNKKILRERFEESGVMSGHYFHQDLYVARRIFQHNPQRHVDVGSRTDGFVAHVAVFREIEIFDIREQTKKVKNVIFKQADLTQLPAELINYCDSISSLHAIEHFGLGRYNDAIDYFGYLKAIQNLGQILQPGGRFYFSVPMGPQRIEFNAHRVFSIAYVLELFHEKFVLNHFSYVNDAGDIFEDVNLTQEAIENNLGCWYGCGIFEFTKRS